jgi:UDP-glucuronate 4-epimerase
MKVLITGCAGFIGFHTSLKFIKKGYHVVGVDNINDYYDVKLKKKRLNILKKLNIKKKYFSFEKIDISNSSKIEKVFKKYNIKFVVNLAAQAGVRYSLINPRSYLNTNLVGFFNILDCSKRYKIKHLVYASTSSVYGANENFPLRENKIADHPIQFYAATKRSNELMAHSYSSIHNLPTTGLRFFTVYGPWGRPDMALYIFTKNIIQGKKIPLFNHGNHSRSFTYVDDIIDGVLKSTIKIPKKNKLWSSKNPDPSSGNCPFRILNIGNNKTESLKKYLRVLEQNIGKKAKIKNLGIQRGDIVKTSADLSKISKEIGFYPKTNIETGIKKFVNWYKEYHKIK